MNQGLYPLLFEHNLHEVVWGGHRLKPLKGLQADGQHIGESWEISNIPTSDSVVSNGYLAGQTLTSVIERWGAALLGHRIAEKYGSRLPLLVKFIDAARDLSIQVHPNDRLALQRHGKLGKAEMWYVMKAEPGAALYAGLREKITPEQYERRVAEGTIVDVLARHEVRPGDVFYIPAGRIHAICGGIMVCEIQESSDVTYRIFDYNRPGLDGKPRELHTEQAREAIDYYVYPSYKTPYKHVRDGVVCVTNCPSFKVNLVTASSSLQRRLRSVDSFVTLSCVSGKAVISVAGGHVVHLSEGYSCLLPAVLTDYTVASADDAEVRMLEAWACSGAM